jgi:hypothetical protein
VREIYAIAVELIASIVKMPDSIEKFTVNAKFLLNKRQKAAMLKAEGKHG